MNPFMGEDSKSAIAIILHNSDKKEGEGPSEENFVEVAMKGFIKAINAGNTKKAIKAFKILIDCCDEMGDEDFEDENSDKMEY